MSELLDRAERGEASEADVVRHLRAEPRTWRFLGDLALQARASFARVLGHKHLGLKHSMQFKADEVLAEVAGPNPTPLERLLAERIATTWLELYALDMMVAQEVKPGVGKLLPAGVEAADKRRGRAHRRYLAAIHELALVRRLLVPALRVHIDQRRQVRAEDVTPPRPALPPSGAAGS
jgi:hypothetical protein